MLLMVMSFMCPFSDRTYEEPIKRVHISAYYVTQYIKQLQEENYFIMRKLNSYLLTVTK